MFDSVSGNTKPLWLDTAIARRQGSQAGLIEVDVCVIGAGITGLTAADLLKQGGKTVAIVELSRIAFGETGHTTAHLTEILDLDYRDLLGRFGLERGQLVCQSVRRAIERIEENIARYSIACDFERLPGYQYTDKKEQVAELEAEARAAISLGVPVEILDEAPVPFKTLKALKFEHQAQFHPVKYLSGLAENFVGNGSYIFEETRMLDITEGQPCRVTTDRGTILAKQIIVAANVPSSNKFVLHTKIAAYRTYAIAAKIVPGSAVSALLWDIDEPYHYVRRAMIDEGEFLIIGGEDHKTGHEGHTHNSFEKLEAWAKTHFNILTIEYRWSGQIIEPVDGLPFIGMNPLSENIYVATGFSGNGMTFGTVAGMILSDMILGRANPWQHLYDPSRVKPLAS